MWKQKKTEQQCLISGQWQKQSNWQSFDCENWYSGAYFHQGQWNVSHHAHSSLPRTHAEGCSLVWWKVTDNLRACVCLLVWFIKCAHSLCSHLSLKNNIHIILFVRSFGEQITGLDTLRGKLWPSCRHNTEAACCLSPVAIRNTGWSSLDFHSVH